jgi:hypothetical protein
MRLDKNEHERHPWRVRSLAADFELLDVWDYPIVADAAAGEDFSMFCRMLADETGGVDPPVRGFAGFLFRVRNGLGRLLKLDEPKVWPIPGCAEVSLRERLSEQERLKGPASTEIASIGPGFKEVYRLDNEILMEISNKTVHALLHVGWVHKEGSRYAPQLAVYSKSRGRWGRMYMWLISPFRHWVVYPALMRSAKKKWEALRARAGNAPSRMEAQK